MPYEYRRMTPEQRKAVLHLRTSRGFPLHAPPHPLNEKTYYLLTAANFEHKHIMVSAQRRAEFQKLVLEKFREAGSEIVAWVFLANHYHFYSTLNYIHYNPVKHGYTKRMDEWEWSSFGWYLEEMGRDWLLEIWKKYPITGYGEKWDIF